MQNKQRTSLEDALPKIRTYCNYRDRSHHEVKQKLRDMGVWSRDVEQAIGQMIEENLLNEERYVRSFIRGHFYNKKWGRKKIRYELSQHRIPDRLITRCMDEIDEDDYEQCVQQLIEKKRKELTGTPWERRQKLSRYLQQKGFSYAEFKAFLP